MTDFYAEQIELGYRVQTALAQENWPGYGIVTDPTPFRVSIIVRRGEATR